MIVVTDEQRTSPPERAWIKDVCKIGRGAERCRYLVCGRDGFGCGKHNVPLQLIIDARVAMNVIVAHGDNCEGRAEP